MPGNLLRVRPGEKVAIWLVNCPEWIFAMFALAKIGAVHVPINTRFRTVDLAQVLERSNTSTLITHDVSGPVDNVLHFPSPASPADFERLPIQILKVGAHGTHNALGLARAKNARFLLDWFLNTEDLPPEMELWWVGPNGWMCNWARRLRNRR